MKPQRRILIVDDSAEDRNAFRRFLQQDTEYRNLVEEVITGDVGVEACRRASFDAVLLDHHMPRMDGLETLKALHALPGWSTPVLALTSTGRSDVASRMLEAGATDFLFKDDITASSLSRAITNAITKERLQRRVEKTARRTARLQQVTAELSRARTPRQVVDVFLQHAMDMLGAAAGFLALLSEDGTHLELDASPGFDEDTVRKWRRILLSSSLPITDAARTGALVACGSREELSARYPVLKDAILRFPALAAVPLRVGDNRLGAVVVYFSESHAFDEEEQDFLLVLTRQCAQALERAQLYEAARTARDAARLEEERFRALILASSPVVWRADALGQGGANIAVQGTRTGIPFEQSVGVRWMEALHPEDREATLGHWREAVQSEQMFRSEFRVRAQDGNWRSHLSHAVPVRGPDGNVREWIGANWDVTEERRAEAERSRLYAALQESESQRRLALEAARLGTWTWEIGSGHVDMDEVGRALLGLAPEGPLRAEMLGTHVHPEDLARALAALQGFIASDTQTEYELEYRVLPLDGGVRWVVSRGRMVRDTQGHSKRLVGVCYDITERKSFEIGLMRQREAEKQRADFEQQLVGIVSHDLKNPLAAILMQSAMAVRQGGLDARTLKMMTRIQSSAERASRMIRDLLDFTQARLGGGIPLQVRELDAREVIVPVLEEVRQAFPHRQLSFESVGDTTGVWDGDRLAQVITNLVQNAVKYSPEATGIEVRLLSDGPCVELTVHNHGAPIPAERIPHLFEPLQRATSLEDKSGRSVGLGLYIVKHIVEAHQGTIAVSSHEGEGTLFRVRLPRHVKQRLGSGL
ncbi:PAS domain-containing protein [Hyalangium versicolor]|uniref:PAS domain-containing protein n=1 Tax=Hyalangium versicolor TaxID=2861190 RepID=UPI001CCEDAC4|nr:PAS domain-containing protein [Hyalangium versicolor]